MNGLFPIQRTRVVTDFLGWAAIAHPLALLLAPYSSLADLATPFHELAIGSQLLAAGAALRWGPRLRSLGLIALALLGLDPLLRFSGPNPVVADTRGGDRLKVVVLNVYWKSDQHDVVRDYLGRESADVVGLIEVSSEWLEALADLRATYPYRIERPGFGQGLALWSRRPFVDGNGAIVMSRQGGPLATAVVPWDGATLRLWLVHPPCPITFHGPDPSSTNGLLEVGRLIASQGGRAIVFGDLNRTDGSPHFDAFQHTIGLRDSRLGFGRQVSWPTWSPYRIALDHAFLSEDLAVLERALGPDVGSDHLPFRLVVAPASSAKTELSQSSE